MKCAFCPKSYQSQNDLDKHLKIYHKFTGQPVILNDNVLSITMWAEEHNVKSL